MKNVKSLIKSIDAFAQPITLTFYQKRRFSTLIGGILTISMITLLIVISINKIDDVINHQNLIASSIESIHSVPPSNKINNMFAFSFDPPILNALKGKVYFDFEVVLPIYTRLDNGTQIKDKSSRYSLSQCNSSHFPMFSDEQLRNYGINTWVCANLPTNAEVQGDYNSPVYKFIQIKVSKCGTSPNIRTKQDNCSSDDEISKIKLQYGGKLYLNLQFINNLINLDNFDQPLTPYIDQISFLVDFPNTFVQKELSLTQVNILTDPSIFYNKRDYAASEASQGSIYEGKISQLGLNQPQNETGRINYISLYFKSDAKNKILFRKYSTFQDVLQLIGSFWSLCYLLFGLLNQILVKYNLLIKLANSLFIFPSLDKDLNISNNHVKIETNLQKKGQKSKFREMFRFNSKKTVVLNDLASLQDKENTKKFKFSPWMVFNNVFKNEKKEYKLGDIHHVVHRALDINQILQNNNELQKLKQVLLTKEQQMLLNFSTKPTFLSAKHETSINVLKYEEKLKKKNRKHLKIETNPLYKDLFKSYQNIKEDRNLINEKIIEILDPEIIKFFEKYRNNSDVVKFNKTTAGNQIEIEIEMQNDIPEEIYKNERKTIKI